MSQSPGSQLDSSYHYALFAMTDGPGARSVGELNHWLVPVDEFLYGENCYGFTCDL